MVVFTIGLIGDRANPFRSQNQAISPIRGDRSHGLISVAKQEGHEVQKTKDQAFPCKEGCFPQQLDSPSAAFFAACILNINHMQFRISRV